MEPLTTVELLQHQNYGPRTTEASVRRGLQVDYNAVNDPFANHGSAIYPLQDIQNGMTNLQYPIGNKPVGRHENKNHSYPHKRFKAYPSPSQSVAVSISSTEDLSAPEAPYQDPGPLTDLSLVLCRSPGLYI